MWFLWFVATIIAYLTVGFVLALIVGWCGGFNYRQRRDEFSPNTLKWLIFFLWPIWLILLVLIDLPTYLTKRGGAINEKFNKLVGIPTVDKPRKRR